MKFQKQLIQHDPANGRFGDCWRTCIACLLDMDAADVPHFVASETAYKDADGTIQKMKDWLKTRGFTLIGFPISGLPAWQEAAKGWFADAPYILTGQSPNHEGVNHCVIGMGGFEVLFDVAASGKGLAGPYKGEDGSDLYWIEFIVPYHGDLARAA